MTIINLVAASDISIIVVNGVILLSAVVLKQ